MSETPLPRRHEESPRRRQTFATGRTGENGKLVTFPASRPDPDDRPSDRIVPGTPADKIGDALSESLIREAVERGLCAADRGTIDRRLIENITASLVSAIRIIATKEIVGILADLNGRPAA